MADEAPEVEDEPTDETPDTEQGPPEGTLQEPADEGGKFDPSKALEKIRKLNSEAANLRKRVKDAEGKAAGTDEKETRIKALEAENLRIRIGARHGLPDTLIDRLKGDTEDEILADAEKLLELVSSSKRPPTAKPAERLRGGGDPTTEPEETDISKIGERMFRR
jgi:hypothetical protein